MGNPKRTGQTVDWKTAGSSNGTACPLRFKRLPNNLLCMQHKHLLDPTQESKAEVHGNRTHRRQG